MLLPVILFIDIDWIRHNIAVEDSSFISLFYARKKVIVIININAMFIREKKNKKMHENLEGNYLPENSLPRVETSISNV
jgi:hypothetical protein